MSATFNWSQTNGAGAGTVTDLAGSGNVFNFKDIDDATPSNFNTHPIIASDTADQGRSYEIWLRGKFSSSFNNIDNLKFWKSTDFSPSTGLTVYWKGNNVGAYTQPVKIDSTKATATVPTSNPGTANVSIGGSLSGAITSAGYSDYIILQADVATTATAGESSLATFSLQYDEF